MEQTICRLLDEFNLSSYSDRIKNSLLPSVRYVTYASSESGLELGVTKIGGRPDLPVGMTWPTNDEHHPYSFVCQLNLSEHVSYSLSCLPHDGMIYIFHNHDAEFSGEYPVRDNIRVFYLSDANVELARISYPATLEKRFRYKPAKVCCQPEPTLPPLESTTLKEIGIDYENAEMAANYIAFLNKFSIEMQGLHDVRHRLLGHPDQLQDNLEERAVRYSSRLSTKSPLDKWRLLLQIDSDTATGMMWGDAGRMYLMIRENDLEKGNFENVAGFIQC